MLLRETEMTQPAIAEAMDVFVEHCKSPPTGPYDGGEIKVLKPKLIGRPQRENITLSHEKTLLARFSKAGKAGEMLNIHDL
jgi:hypothetical protein